MQQHDERLSAVIAAVIKIVMRKNMIGRLGTANGLAMKKRARFEGDISALIEVLSRRFF